MGTFFALGSWFIVLGLALMGASAGAVRRARRETALRVPAPGVVVELRAVGGLRGSIQCPVVRFHDESGEPVTFRSTMGGWPPLHVVGQQVTVFYPRGSPREAELEAPRVLWLVPAGIFAIGLLFAAAGAVLVLISMAASPA